MSPRTRMMIEALGLALALLGAGLFAPHTTALMAVQLFCLLYVGYALAPLFFPDHAPIPRLFLMVVTILGLQSILQTCAYYLLPSLGLATDIVTQMATIVGLYGAVWHASRITHHASRTTIHDSRLVFHVSRFTFHVFALIGASFVIFHAHLAATTAAIRTPWAILPSGTLLAFLLIVGALWLLAWWRHSSTDTWIVSSMFLMTLALVTVLVYPLGFGFDGFLHRESERLLLTTGTLHPKPLYYIGQYVLTTWLSRTLALPIGTVDPFLLVGFIPILTAALAIKRSRSIDGCAAISMLALILLIPLKPWITSTPQSFAYLIGLSGLLLATTSTASINLWPALILGMWSVAIHPLAGLPLLGGTILLLWRARYADRPSLRLAGSLAATLGTALIVPLAFFLNSQHAGAHITWHVRDIFSIDHLRALGNLFVSPPLRISLFADWASFVEFLSPFFLFLLAMIGLRRKSETPSSPWLVMTGLLTILVAWFMQRTATFAFLIDYERQDYTSRLILVGQLLLIPAALEGFALIWQRVKREPALALYGFLLFTFAWQAARIYHAFPYHDATHTEHGWNVSAFDKEAVRWMDRDAAHEPYTVLANQSVSAAAISELGFKRYAGDVFFYPVPTGGSLYKVFLRAGSPHVTLDDIREAARLGQSKRVYVVLNRYWWQADKVALRLTYLAQSTYDLGQGDVRIYRFDVSNDKNR